MKGMNPAIFEGERTVATDVMRRGDSPEGIYPNPVGDQYMQAQ